jgi:hypothetical protein
MKGQSNYDSILAILTKGKSFPKWVKDSEKKELVYLCSKSYLTGMLSDEKEERDAVRSIVSQVEAEE